MKIPLLVAKSNRYEDYFLSENILMNTEFANFRVIYAPSSLEILSSIPI